MPDQFSLFDEPPAADARGASAASSIVAPAVPSPARVALGRALPEGVRLGTSSWAFPGWRGIVYEAAASESLLAREGLRAYAAHPLLRMVGIDRTFYGPIDAKAFASYAGQVPAAFRFLVKAPAIVTDVAVRGAGGKPTGDNPRFLDAGFALERFVAPVLEGLATHAGPLVFQFSPFGRRNLADPGRLIEAMGRFFASLRGAIGPRVILAVEIRDPEMLQPASVARFVDILATTDVRFCFGVHARMPSIAAQASLFHALPPGPFVARWSLHAGYAYEEAKRHYAPFDRLVEEDPGTRMHLAQLVNQAIDAGNDAFVTVNNKAEGSAPLSVEKLAEAIVDARR